MVSENWYSEIESTLHTVLLYKLVEREDAPFPKLNCTTSSENESLEGVSDFPALYIHLLPPQELGQDLTNETVNALNATLELQVFSNESEGQCRDIMSAAISEMKKLRFNIQMFPDPQTSDKKYFAIARFNRVIGAGDSDIVQQEES